MAFLPTLIKKQREFRRNQQLSRAALEYHKLEKFRKLIQFAQQHSPYYAQIIREHQIDPDTCHPTDFPVLTKPTVVERFDDLVTDRSINKAVVADFLAKSTDPMTRLFGKYQVLHTSGSSGQIGYYLYSQDDWARGVAQNTRQPRSLGGGLWRRPRAAYFGATNGHFGGISLFNTSKRAGWGWLLKTEAFEVNQPLGRVIEGLNRFQPDLIAGYTTAIKVLAEKQLAGELQLTLRSATTGGEPQNHADRALIQQAFGCPVANSYGCTEHLMMGFSTPDQQHLMLYDDDLIYEFYDDHILVTNLFNYTQPLIRYRMSDVLRPLEDNESVSPYLLVKSLVGRTELTPNFINAQGETDFINPITVVELFIPGVNRFQMQLISDTHFDFLICIHGGEDKAAAIEATRRRVAQMLEEKAMQNVSFNVEVVEDLPVDEKTGKFKLILDKRAT